MMEEEEEKNALDGERERETEEIRKIGVELIQSDARVLKIYIKKQKSKYIQEKDCCPSAEKKKQHETFDTDYWS